MLPRTAHGKAIVELDVPARMRDGTVLRADVYRPEGAGRWPVLLIRTPYGKSFANWWFDYLGAVRRGYVVVVQDTRGRFASEGEWLPFVFEKDDGFDTVEWAASLPSSTGQVGMLGRSYLGNAQWSAAIAQPPALKALFPQITWSDPFDGLYMRGNAVELGINIPWSLLQGLDVLVRRYSTDVGALEEATASLIEDIDDLPTRTYWELPAGNSQTSARHALPDLGTGSALADPRLAERCTVAGNYAGVGLPTFNVGGWYDVFSQGTIDNFVAMSELGRPAMLLMGPWGHGQFVNPVGDLNFGYRSEGAFIDLPSLQLRWFDHWLKDIDTGLMDEPPVKIFVMGINRWRSESTWPLTRSVETAYFLRAQGELSETPPLADEAPDEYWYDPGDPVPTLGGSTLMSPDFPFGPRDQRPIENRADVLVFTSAPLPADLEATGRLRLQLHAASSAPSTDWVARICDVWPDGRSFNVADGIWRVGSNADSAGEHTIDLWSTSMVFRAGHRIRVHIASSSFPRWDRNLNSWSQTAIGTARQTIFHDAGRPTRILLPVIPA